MAEYYTGDGGTNTTGGGAGTTHALRWLTIQYALDNMTSGQPNRLNIRGLTTPEGDWDFTIYGNPIQDNPLLFQGYDTVAGDGTIATIDGGTAAVITGDLVDSLGFRHLKFKNWGAGDCLSIDNYHSIVECEFDGEGVRASAIDVDNGLMLIGCKIHSLALNGFAVTGAAGCHIVGNYIQIDSATSSDNLIRITQESSVIGNVLSLNTIEACDGIHLIGDNILVMNNSIFNDAAGKGRGIAASGAGADDNVILNNIVEGFSGVGGIGIQAPANGPVAVYGYNKFYNNTTNDGVTDVLVNLGNNDVFGASPFTTTGSANHNDDDFSLTSSYLAASYPSYPTELYDPDDTQAGRNQNTQDVGALQSTPSGGGAGDTIVVKQNVRY